METMTAAPRPSSARVVPCPVCEGGTRREDGFADVILYRCVRCEHCFTDVAALDRLVEYDDAWDAQHTNWFANPNFALFEFIARTIERHKADASVVDLGAGRGDLLRYLRQRNAGLSLTGLDIAYQPSIEGVEFVQADIAAFDAGDRRWDVAVSLAVIEHLPDVRGFAATLGRLVVPGGLAIVMTLDDRSVLYGTARLLKKLGYRVAFERLYDRHHLNHFNPTSLRVLMERNGFKPLTLHRHNLPLAAVDMPRESPILRAGVWGTFVLGRLTGRTFLQTLVARNA